MWSGEHESFERPPPPAVPHEARGEEVLTLSERALEATLQVFDRYASRRVESCCFWYGKAANNRASVVRAVVVPPQENHWGNYRVTASAVEAMSRATREQRWLNLAQVHTHPGRWVGHSPYDDAQANSTRTLSLVFPSYGRWLGDWPKGVGIHEFQNDYWHLLPDEAAAQRVVLGGPPAIEVLDLR